MAVNCVRYTVIESYHTAGKISEAEMMAFNKEVVDRIYTFLTLYFAETDESSKLEFVNRMNKNYPTGWDSPKLDPNLAATYHTWLEKGVKCESD